MFRIKKQAILSAPVFVSLVLRSVAVVNAWEDGDDVVYLADGEPFDELAGGEKTPEYAVVDNLTRADNPLHPDRSAELAEIKFVRKWK